MKAAIVMGSDSDFPIVEKGYKLLKDFGVDVTVRVISAHRTPDEAISFAKNAEKNGYELIIGAAGKAAHLPGILAGCTPLPVIGLPIKSSELDGMDALLGIQILSVKYPELREKFKEYKQQMADKVFEKNKKLNDKLMEG